MAKLASVVFNSIRLMSVDPVGEEIDPSDAIYSFRPQLDLARLTYTRWIEL